MVMTITEFVARMRNGKQDYGYAEARAEAMAGGKRLEEMHLMLKHRNVPWQELVDALRTYQLRYAEAVKIKISDGQGQYFLALQDSVRRWLARLEPKFDEHLWMADEHQKKREQLPALLEEKAASAKAIPSAGARAMALKIIEEVRERQAAAEFIPEATALQDKLTEMNWLVSRLKQLRIGEAPAVSANAAMVARRLVRCQAMVASLETQELQEGAKAVLADLAKRLEAAPLGLLPNGLPHTHTGRANIDLAPGELTRVISAAVAGVEAALSKPASAERELLVANGPERFAAGLLTMNSNAVIHGMNFKPLSPAEALAINCYMGSDYGAMNALRRGASDAALTPQEVKRLELLNRICDQALAKLPKYPDEAWPAFRAERAWSQDVVDKRYALKASFMTEVLWSTGAGSAFDIAVIGRPTPKFTHVIYGASGRDVAAMAVFMGEGGGSTKGYEASANRGKGEVLFPATARFRVEGRKNPAVDADLLRYRSDGEGGALVPIETRLKELKHG